MVSVGIPGSTAVTPRPAAAASSADISANDTSAGLGAKPPDTPLPPAPTEALADSVAATFAASLPKSPVSVALPLHH
jgi:hypothetical protein